MPAPAVGRVLESLSERDLQGQAQVGLSSSAVTLADVLQPLLEVPLGVPHVVRHRPDQQRGQPGPDYLLAPLPLIVVSCRGVVASRRLGARRRIARLASLACLVPLVRLVALACLISLASLASLACLFGLFGTVRLAGAARRLPVT